MSKPTIKTKSQQINEVAKCVENLLVAIQASAGYFTDAETFEQCHQAVAKKVFARVKSGKVGKLDVENVLYFVNAGMDLDLIKTELKTLAVKDSPELASEVLDIDDDEERANATSSHIDSNTYFNK